MPGRARTRRDAIGAMLLITAGLGASMIRGPRSAAAEPGPVVLADGRRYDAYIPAASKPGQFDQYTCEFDAAWVIFKTFGLEVTLEEQVAILGVDDRIDPYVEQTPDGYVIYGGDIDSTYSGDYTSSFLARTTGQAMRKVFEAYELGVEPVSDRSGLETALARGALIWIKSTVDFQPWEPVTWITPDGEQLPGVLGNDHAVVVIGYNAEVVVIRDVLGPTSTNWERPLEYEVDWATFLPVWEAQGFDGLAVSPVGMSPEAALPPIVPLENSD